MRSPETLIPYDPPFDLTAVWHKFARNYTQKLLKPGDVSYVTEIRVWDYHQMWVVMTNLSEKCAGAGPIEPELSLSGL